jgi:hypothetical protein
MVVYAAKFHGQDRIIVAHGDVAMVLGAEESYVEITGQGELVSTHGEVRVGDVKYTDLRELK